MMKNVFMYALCALLISGEITMAPQALKKYNAKRNFKESIEPKGKVKKGNKQPIFTIQKHNASHLHYDFRIEVDGVMPSWAVPKGPSLDPKVKRLAIMTEDHPMDYARFEGTIAPGNYGAGQVIVWDIGTYENIKHDHDGVLIPLAECIKRGTVEIFLHGTKLQGAYALIRTHLDNGKDWLLIKMRDEYANARRNPVSTQPESAISGVTIGELKKGKTIEQKKVIKKKIKAVAKKNSKVSDDSVVKINGIDIEITHPEKIIFPKSNITKKEFVSYYERVAPYMLPHLKNHPISMQRFVDGIDKPGFYQKEAGSYFPDYIDKVTVKKEGGVVHEVIVNNAQSLVYLANQLVITFHRWLSTAAKLDFPDILIFDLDPSGTDFDIVRSTALSLKKVFEKLGLVPYVMTTGSKGLHVVAPLKGDVAFDEVRSFAHEIAQIMVDGMPELTLEMRKDKRDGRIFMDYLRNGFSATAVCPYSVRPKEGAPVAAPLEWAEVAKKSLKPDQFTIKNIFKRLERKGDLWKNIRKDAVSLKMARKKLDKLKNEHRL